jgi:tetratricopeptide (TPR) repeat protein
LDRALSLLAQIETREGYATRADRERRSHALILCGDIRQMESDDEVAVDFFRQALRIDEALWEEFPDDARRASEVGFGYLRIAFSAMLRGAAERSNELVGRALHALNRAEELEPENLARQLHTAEAYWSRARTGIARGASPDSIQRDLAEAARRQRAWLQSYPLDAHNLRIFVLTLSLGIGHPGATAQQRKGYFEDCLKATRALQRLEPDALLDVAAVGASLAECASYLVGEGQVEDGLALAEEAVTIADGVVKSATGERFAMTALAGTLRMAGLLFVQHGDRDKGHQLLRRAVEAARANFSSRPSGAESVVWFARFLSGLDTEEAATEALRVLDQFRASGRGWTEELESLHTKALARVR